MICLDTHVWHWWVSGDPRLPRRMRQWIEGDQTVISAVSIWELALLVRAGRVRLKVDTRDYLRSAIAWEGLSVTGITPDIAVRASRFGPLFPGDPMDRLISATAIELGVALVTSDEAISRSGVVPVLWD